MTNYTMLALKLHLWNEHIFPRLVFRIQKTNWWKIIVRGYFKGGMDMVIFIFTQFLKMKTFTENITEKELFTIVLWVEIGWSRSYFSDMSLIYRNNDMPWRKSGCSYFDLCNSKSLMLQTTYGNRHISSDHSEIY